ncbi:hypothetical protein D9M68_967400 [compost metagenome]
MSGLFLDVGGIDQCKQQGAARLDIVAWQRGDFFLEILEAQVDVQRGGVVAEDRACRIEFARFLRRQEHDGRRVGQRQGA